MYPDPMGYAAPAGAPNRQLALPPEYSSAMFQNLQAMNRGQTAANRQGIMDNARNPAMSGVQQMLLQQNQRQGADTALNNATQVQLQGANSALQDRRTNQQQQYESGENAKNRALQQWMTSQQIQAQKDMLGSQQDYANSRFMPNLLGGIGSAAFGALGGPVFGAMGGAMANFAAPDAYAQILNSQRPQTNNYYGG